MQPARRHDILTLISHLHFSKIQFILAFMIDSKELCGSVSKNQVLIYETKRELADRQTQIAIKMAKC